MRRELIVTGVMGSLAVVGATWWRSHRRFGARWVNHVADPWLIAHDVTDKSAGAIGLIEHVGRRTGVVRVSPVRPVTTDDGFRIVVPLGLESNWAQNVLTAGRCRLQVGGMVYELDAPVLVPPSNVAGLPLLTRGLMAWLGFRYLSLHRVAVSPGTLSGRSLPSMIHRQGDRAAA
jgi:deazaflavin-dependent oxidoreductase (nitroreductase family)